MQVLVCEEHPIIGLVVVENLISAGYQAVGPIETVDAALKMARDAELLGCICCIKLAEASCEAIIEILRDRGLPVILTSASLPSERPAALADLMMFDKPYDVTELIEAAKKLFGSPARLPQSAVP